VVEVEVPVVNPVVLQVVKVNNGMMVTTTPAVEEVVAEVITKH
jgi:hypothetical protein